MNERIATATYVAALVRELAVMAQRRRLTLLAHVLSIASLQAHIDASGEKQ